MINSKTFAKDTEYMEIADLVEQVLNVIDNNGDQAADLLIDIFHSLKQLDGCLRRVATEVENSSRSGAVTAELKRIGNQELNVTCAISALYTHSSAWQTGL